MSDIKNTQMNKLIKTKTARKTTKYVYEYNVCMYLKKLYVNHKDVIFLSKLKYPDARNDSYQIFNT